MTSKRQKGGAFVMKDRYSVEELLEIMAFLRSEEGCPWDRVQTHESIQGNFLEEAYEAVDAIRKGDPQLLKEELGDVLMQVVFHSGIAGDAGQFDFDDVVSGICRKLISRHTHLFGEDTATTPDMVLHTWEKNKRLEKGFRSAGEAMEDIPRSLPALIRSFKLQKKAADVGFDWPSVDGARDKMAEELAELLEEVDKGDKIRAAEEAGDLLFAVVNVLRILGIDPESALSGSSERFIRRFRLMEELAGTSPDSFSGMSLEEMDSLWNEAKKTLASDERTANYEIG